MTRILVVLLWLIPCSLFAQRIEGKVVDSEGQPLSFVNIVLLTQRDSTFVTGTTTDTEGLFSLSRPSVGFYLLQFTSIGFETVTLPCPDGGKMQDVTLRSSTTQLGDVVVNGSLPTHKLTADGLQTQVQGTVLGKLGTAEDVLAHVPGLQKKSNGYEVFGKGSPIIYINGRQLRDLSELEQLKSDQVKSVELITSPGARYDASVGAVVRIKTVQPRGEGFGIDARSTWQQSDNADLINQVNLNYQNKGLTVFGMGYFATMGEYQISTVRQDIKADTIWQQRNDLKSPNRRGQLKAQAGLNYIFNENHALGFRIDARKMLNFHGTTFTISEITANGQPYEHSELFNRDDLINSCTHAANLYYNGKVAGWTIDLNADWQKGEESYGSRYDEQSESFESRELSSQNYIHNDLWAAKLVLEHELFGGKLTVGAEYTHTDRKDDYINPEGFVPTTYTVLKDRGISPFVEYSIPLPFGQLQAGVRYEAIQFDYFSNGVHQQEQSRSFHNWFPSVSLATQLGKVQAMLSAGVKTRRPTYRELRGNVSYINRFTLQTGNPYLRPSTLYDMALQLQWKCWSFKVNYNDTRDAVLNFATQKAGQESVTILGYQNFKTYKQLNVQLVAAPQIGKWRPQFGVVMLKPWLKLETASETLHFNRPIFAVMCNNSFQFTPTFFGDCTLQFTSKGEQQNARMDKATCTVSASLTKTFLKDRLSLKVGVSDIFRTRESVVLFNHQMNIAQTNLYDSRHFDLTLRYSFNATSNKYKGTGAGNAEKQRL